MGIQIDSWSPDMIKIPQHDFPIIYYESKQNYKYEWMSSNTVHPRETMSEYMLTYMYMYSLAVEQ